MDLETKLITLHTKAQQTIDDATIRTLVANAGYDVTNITREGK